MVCVLCGKRISEWEINAGKVLVLKSESAHKACLIDKEAESGKDTHSLGKR